VAREIPLPFGANEIRKYLPHRYPFLMLDQVVEFRDGEHIVGIKNVSVNEEYFQGHFPDQPIMPGVLILEAMAQLGALYARLSTNGAKQDSLMVFAGADEVRFRRRVYPGDQVRIVMGEYKRRGGFWRMPGKAYVGSDLAAEAIVMANEL
jgi:3-hydroxyacyl-[acyl-carrier-protein] dehydratase